MDLLAENDLWMQNSNRVNKYFKAVFEKNNKQCDCGAIQTKWYKSYDWDRKNWSISISSKNRMSNEMMVISFSLNLTLNYLKIDKSEFISLCDTATLLLFTRSESSSFSSYWLSSTEVVYETELKLNSTIELKNCWRSYCNFQFVQWF